MPPRMDIGGAEFVRADIRNPIIAKVIQRGWVGTVVHMGVIATPVPGWWADVDDEINVIGTMRCRRPPESPSVRKLVVKSRRRSTVRARKDQPCSPRRWS